MTWREWYTVILGMGKDDGPIVVECVVTKECVCESKVEVKCEVI